MSRETIEREIARFEEIGRVRMLDHGETIQLDKLIKAERAMLRRRAAGAASRAAYRSPRASIVRRLVATIHAMAVDQMAVRAIYLSDADREELLATEEPHVGIGMFRGHPLRRAGAGKNSGIYSTRGIKRAVRNPRLTLPSTVQTEGA